MYKYSKTIWDQLEKYSEDNSHELIEIADTATNG